MLQTLGQTNYRYTADNFLIHDSNRNFLFLTTFFILRNKRCLENETVPLHSVTYLTVTSTILYTFVCTGYRQVGRATTTDTRTLILEMDNW